MNSNPKSKKIFFLIFIILFVFLFSSVFICLYVPVSFSKDVPAVRIEIPTGTSTKKIGQILKEKKIIRSSAFFYVAARLPVVFGRKSPYSLKSGVYNVSSCMSLMQILSLLESGRQEYIKIMIPEGLTMRKTGIILEEGGICPESDFYNSCFDKTLLQKYGIPSENAEGLLFPDTYYFTPDMNSSDVVSIMIENFMAKAELIPQFKNKKISEFYDTVILASIVEREYRVEQEAPLIASVFTNRIADNAGLYSCATIEYIITELQGKPHPEVISYDDLKIDSPYNTYKWAGLTPGPISNPGLVALKAAANPPETDYYYFTLNNAEKGTHTFSRSFNSHTQAGTVYKTKKAAEKK